MLEEILIKIGADAVLGPVLTSIVTKVVTKHRSRKRCAVLYTLMTRAPPSFFEDVAKMGVDEGCWTREFVDSFKRRVLPSVARFKPKEPSQEDIELARKAIASLKEAV